MSHELPTFPVREVQSGRTDTEHWVSIHFESDELEHDVVHVVCALDVDDQDVALGMDRMYFERDGQSRGGYGGADAVVVSQDGVELRWNAQGMQDLAFRAPVRLAWPGRVKGKANAIRRFAKMRQYPWGEVVHVDA